MNELIGCTVTEIRAMTQEELDREGWDDIQGTAVALVFNDGTVVYPSRDPEGNGPGALFGYDGVNSFTVAP